VCCGCVAAWQPGDMHAYVISLLGIKAMFFSASIAFLHDTDREIRMRGKQ
jgi:hypothetical protein